METKASDLSAKLLATENLSIIRAAARTASFDIKSRVLTIPMWKDMTPEIEEMLVGHEVGHALYTGEKYIEPIRENPKMMSYLNVLEDVRIEKLIKRKYPGLRKRMNEGYKQLNDRDFFGVKQVQNFDELLLIDKINLYYKAGFQCGVTFTAEEKVFCNRAERCETVEDVISLAKEVWEYSKQKADEQKKLDAQKPTAADEGDEDTDFESDPDADDADEEHDDTATDGAGKDAGHTEEDELVSKTERMFQSKLEASADESTDYLYWKFDTDYFKDPIVGYKKVLEETRSPEAWSEELSRNHRYAYNTRHLTDQELKIREVKQLEEFESFKAESLRTVNYLVKEFEMKKSAQLFKRAQVSKIGSLDMKKIYAYKLQDDLFKRVTTLPEGKNHGMVMLLDWSGSMHNVLQDTIKQVINLAMFCRRVQIPFRVLAFTTDYKDASRHSSEYSEHAYKKHNQNTEHTLNTAYNFNLIELFSDKMSTVEFNAMCRRAVHDKFCWNDGYGTSGTPLNEALVYCYQFLDSYIKKAGIEKMTFITLTDGEGNALTSLSGRRLEEHRSQTTNGVWKRIRQRHFIKDEVTQKSYEITKNSSTQTEVILRMIKDRYQCTVVGFYICPNGKNSLRSTVYANLPSFSGNVDNLIEDWRKDFRDNGFASVKNTGRDELFLIPQSSTKIQEGELTANSDMSARTIAKNFSKFLNVKKTSRILLNRFVTLIA